jgi:hypothetical protein
MGLNAGGAEAAENELKNEDIIGIRWEGLLSFISSGYKSHFESFQVISSSPNWYITLNPF